MEPVGEFDDDDPDVLRHGQQHFTVGLGLTLLPAISFEIADILSYAVDQQKYFVAEFLSDILTGNRRVFKYVVQRGLRRW